MPFVAAEIRLEHLSKHRFTIADAHYAHAAVLTAIQAVDPAASQTLHDAQRDKPLTIALLEDADSRHSPALLRVAISSNNDSDYVSLLLTAFSLHPTLQIGRNPVRICDVAVSGTSWSGIATWHDLLQENPYPVMRFAFVTPTAIMQQDSEGQRFTMLLPDSATIFRGLHRRWQRLGGPTLPLHLDTLLEKNGCVISSHQLRTIEFQARERTQIGFVGSVTYQCQTRDPHCIRALNALARMAYFTGIGYQTARGMGLVQTEMGVTGR